MQGSNALVVRPGVPSSFLLLVAMPGVASSFLLLVAMPGAPSSVLAPKVRDLQGQSASVDLGECGFPAAAGRTRSLGGKIQVPSADASSFKVEALGFGHSFYQLQTITLVTLNTNSATISFATCATRVWVLSWERGFVWFCNLRPQDPKRI